MQYILIHVERISYKFHVQKIVQFVILRSFWSKKLNKKLTEMFGILISVPAAYILHNRCV